MRLKVFILIIFLVPLISAEPSLNLQHEEIQAGETILATIDTVGEFSKDISSSDITFFEGRREVIFEFDLKEFDGTYYLSINANRNGNFTIKIKDILYREADTLSSKTIEKEIIIEEKILFQEDNSTYTQILEINPGILFSSSPPTIKLINRGTSVLNFSINGEEEISLLPSQTHEKTFTPQSTFSYFEISTYKDFKVPVIYLTSSSNGTEIDETLDLHSEPDLLLSNIIVGEDKVEIIQLFNFGDDTLNIQEIDSDISFLDIDKISEISPRGIQNLSLTFSTQNSRHVQGTINITYTHNDKGEEKILSIPLSLFILPKGSTQEDFEETSQTCSELSGFICSSNQKCEGTPRFTKGGDFCCVGLCEEVSEEPGNDFPLWVIGLLILVVIAIIGFLIWDRARKTKGKKPEDKLKDTTKKYTRRMTGAVQRN